MSGLDKAPAYLKHSVRHPKGYFIITGPAGLCDEGETLQCVHCGMHWKVEPGSGRKRGFCLQCGGPTCGKKECEIKCLPFEKAMEQAEARARARSM